MSMDSQSIYAKKVKLDNAEYNIFDVKKAAVDNHFEIEKLPGPKNGKREMLRARKSA
jgi:hypothetical protein